MKGELPEGWCNTTVGEVFLVTLGQSPPSSTYNSTSEGLPFFQGKAEFGEIYPAIRKWCNKPKKIAKKGDILLSVRAPVGPTNIAPKKCCIGRGLASIRPIAGIDTKFILYFFRSVERYLSKMGTGTTFNAITGNLLKNIQISIPPLPEQNRIVAKIEELFTKLDAGIQALKQAKAQLKQYRQSVLKAAVEGKLTKEWREKHKEKLEPTDKLLEHILKERRDKWENEQLAKYKSKGKKAPKNWKSKYKEPTPPDTTNLPKLPEGWIYIFVKDSINKVPLTNKKLKKKNYLQSGKLPVVDQGQELIGGYTNSDEMKISSEIPLIVFGDHTRIFKYISFDFVAGADGIKVLKPETFYLPKLLFYFLQATKFPIKGYARHFQYLVKSYIPLPQKNEQEKIIKEIDRYLSIINEVKIAINSELKRAQALRQSILKRALEGKLVPQDPNYEPASVLLERIKSEKGKLNQSKRQENS